MRYPCSPALPKPANEETGSDVAPMEPNPVDARKPRNVVQKSPGSVMFWLSVWDASMGRSQAVQNTTRKSVRLGKHSRDVTGREERGNTGMD
jgi:hypothetical protein